MPCLPLPVQVLVYVAVIVHMYVCMYVYMSDHLLWCNSIYVYIISQCVVDFFVIWLIPSSLSYYYIYMYMLHTWRQSSVHFQCVFGCFSSFVVP